uniref:Uncharacterized protein n=1 Tax=Globodera rostochiensis TaxID=31243 RepID=A0A914IBV8_GLORO
MGMVLLWLGWHEQRRLPGRTDRMSTVRMQTKPKSVRMSTARMQTKPKSVRMSTVRMQTKPKLDHFIRPNTEPALNVDATPELGIFGCLIGNTEINHFIRPNTEPALNVDVTPELGIFGCLIGNMETGKVSYFSRTGHMMKTKLASVERAESGRDTVSAIRHIWSRSVIGKMK